MRYAQIVIGPAGSGKSTYCAEMQYYAAGTKRPIDVVNLDPAAEVLLYEPLVDIRSLVHVDSVMELVEIGPNGALVACMEYLMDNIDWFKEQLGHGDDDHVIFDCPGQLELYTHMDVVRDLIRVLQSMDFRVCTVFTMDSMFTMDNSLFISGSLTSLIAKLNLEVAQVNVLTKVNMLDDQALYPRQLSHYDLHGSDEHCKLIEAIARVLDLNKFNFRPLNLDDDKSIADLMTDVETSLNCADDRDCKVLGRDQD